ncbi:hypothetical protein CNQ84_08015 [Pseudomonas abyssi]|uniref:Uncharacterized protein n=1 Tax=Pseudomonas abyssi TaxID=170540 RepID=A0A2A3MIG0_9PSED|nr:hypothetical protein [Pseudomonadales bacterium]PBK04562.1 hypothetical protein CNQ84_08015 [Pseudomonas abyssi]
MTAAPSLGSFKRQASSGKLACAALWLEAHEEIGSASAFTCSLKLVACSCLKGAGPEGLE